VFAASPALLTGAAYHIANLTCCGNYRNNTTEQIRSIIQYEQRWRRRPEFLTDGGVAVLFCETRMPPGVARYGSIILRTGTCTSVTVEMIE